MATSFLNNTRWSLLKSKPEPVSVVRMSQLRMEKTGLSDVPDLAVPAGYVLRTFREGDEAALAKIYAVSKLDKDTVHIVRQDILGDPCFTPDRVFVAEHRGEIVGTASTWIAPDELDAGYLHMVGVLDGHRGKKLGAALTCAALRYSRSEGFNIQRLMTDDWREDAIRLYVDLGFYPLVTDASHPMRWEAISRRIGRPEMMDKLRVSPAPRGESLLSKLKRKVSSVTFIGP